MGSELSSIPGFKGPCETGKTMRSYLNHAGSVKGSISIGELTAIDVKALHCIQGLMGIHFPRNSNRSKFQSLKPPLKYCQRFTRPSLLFGIIQFSTLERNKGQLKIRSDPMHDPIPTWINRIHPKKGKKRQGKRLFAGKEIKIRFSQGPISEVL